jgi:hypothetical protein
MAIVSMQLDPNAAVYSDNDIVSKINAASAQITRSDAVGAAARPIGSNEITSTMLASGVAKTNLDAMTDAARGYIKTAPGSGEFRVVSIQRDSTGKLDIDYDNVAV